MTLIELLLLGPSLTISSLFGAGSFSHERYPPGSASVTRQGSHLLQSGSTNNSLLYQSSPVFTHSFSLDEKEATAHFLPFTNILRGEMSWSGITLRAIPGAAAWRTAEKPSSFRKGCVLLGLRFFQTNFLFLNIQKGLHYAKVAQW